MRKSDERSELIRAVTKRGEAATRAAARLGVPVSTAYRWLRVEDEAAMVAPTFVEVVAERGAPSTIFVRVGVAEIEVRAGFDAALLRAVVESLGGNA